MVAFLGFLIIALLGVSLGGIAGPWVGGLVGGFLLLLTYWLEKWLSMPMRMGRWPLALLAPLVWGLTGGFVAMQWLQQSNIRTATSSFQQPLQRDVEVTASLRSEQGKEVYNLKVEQDKVLYTLTLRYRKGLALTIPKISAHPTFHGPFIMPTPPKIRFLPPQDGVVIKRWELTLLPVLTGPLDTPRFVIRYRKKGKLHKVVVEPIAIEVSELGKPKALLSTLRPLKSPLILEKPTDPQQTLWLAGLGIGFLMLVGFGVWLSRRNAADAATLTPHEWIEYALGALDTKQLREQGAYKQYYFELSEIFRGYLERRFSFAARESTTEEIARWTKHNTKLEKDVARDVRQLLQSMDNVKFAGHIPADEEQDDIESRLHSVLRCTLPTETESDVPSTETSTEPSS